ncbi:hypothetical protein [Marinobacter sp. LQ44]|uniref:hypothetical protein n=1 Tax=unclassified Marinobacter TaxID=83889 RepID=UPI00078DFDB8|nr:hypothetical protein [Marinobacter sp. LQ44]AMQ87760.1 hypothetical protein ASQ50_03175 [Marinobacter sp. LQ44]
MNVIIVAASGAVLVGLYKAVMKPNPPQSPAACGAGFFVSTAGVASVLYLLSLIPSSLVYQFASVLALPLLALIAGYTAARTTEDTSSMNAKIVAGVGFAYSRPRLPLIPDEACHPFHAKAATDSTAKLPPRQAA